MKKWMILAFLLLLCGCGRTESVARAPVGTIGADMAISREMAAKTIALAFDAPLEVESADFSDISPADWAYPYICGCVAQGFFVGSGEGSFRPQDELTLREAQALLDRLAPDAESRIVLTEENQNMAVSYELWVQLLQMALQMEDVAGSLQEENTVLLDADGLCDSGKFSAAGLDLQPYLYRRITFMHKDGEIVALLTVEAASPILRDIYCKKTAEGLALETGAGVAILPFSGEIEEGIADVQLEEGQVVQVTPAAPLGQCVVKRVDAAEVYLAEKGALAWVQDARVYDAREADWTMADTTDLICGTAIAEFYEKDGAICGAVLRETAVPGMVRILLGAKPQAEVALSAEGGFSLSTMAHSKTFAAGETAHLTPDLAWFSAGIVTVDADSPLKVTFADGTSHLYAGTLEMERRVDGIVVVNELSMEEYLLGVVPYEMSADFGQAALEAQAITARSYAYQQFYGNSYCAYGAHLTDSVASQVYQGGTAPEAVQAAVERTAGQCLITPEGKVAQTYFYAASGGFGAGNAEVWSQDGRFAGAAKAYLPAQAYGDFAPPETEEGWLAFWQDWDCENLDMDAPWNRWKVYFSCGQLSEIVAETLRKVSEKNPAHILTKQPDGSFQAGFPQSPGKLQAIAVTQRGEGGVVMELTLTFAGDIVCVRTENAVRQVLSPTKRTLGEEIYLQRKDGASLTGTEMLPSGFFAVKEMRTETGALSGIALYGGGNGHGVGLSQYGAKKLAEEGKMAEEILVYYFPGTSIERVY